MAAVTSLVIMTTCMATYDANAVTLAKRNSRERDDVGVDWFASDGDGVCGFIAEEGGTTCADTHTSATDTVVDSSD